MNAHPRTPNPRREPRPERGALCLLMLAGLGCACAFVALIHAPLPEELVLASLGHEATAGAIGRAATP